MNKNLILIGMPGCGKTYLGMKLAQLKKMEFIDVDQYIEQKTGKTINELFKAGEDYFRKIESIYISEIAQNKNIVISTGGGAVKFKNNMDELKKNGIVIFIDRPINNILKDINIVNRPLLRDNPDKLYKLYEDRYPLYKYFGDYIAVNDGPPDETLKKLVDIAEIVNS